MPRSTSSHTVAMAEEAKLIVMRKSLESVSNDYDNKGGIS